MVKIRLQRLGRKGKPSYRVVVADSRSPRDGARIEVIGHYDPLTNPATVVIQEEKAKEWLQKGAQPSETVASLLRKAGIPVKMKQRVFKPKPVKEEKKEKAAEAPKETKVETKG